MAQLNYDRIFDVGCFLRDQVKSGALKPNPLNFYSVIAGYREIIFDDMYPDLNDSKAPAFFMYAILQNHGFWLTDETGRYQEPLTGMWGGKPAKGSDLLWRMLKRQLQRDPDSFSPARLAGMTVDEFERMMTDDTGKPVAFPDVIDRVRLTNDYGWWMLSNSLDAGKIVALANGSSQPLLVFRALMRLVPGFDKDPLFKKTTLLAMALSSRPERFLQVADGEEWPVIVDYHLMRLALRLGLVELDPMQRHFNEERYLIGERTEEDIRDLVYQAIMTVMTASHLNMAEIDYLFWSARKYCPEMTEPNCEACPLSNVCAKRVELFQPVFRTTAY